MDSRKLRPSTLFVLKSSQEGSQTDVNQSPVFGSDHGHIEAAHARSASEYSRTNAISTRRAFIFPLFIISQSLFRFSYQFDVSPSVPYFLQSSRSQDIECRSSFH